MPPYAHPTTPGLAAASPSKPLFRARGDATATVAPRPPKTPTLPAAAAGGETAEARAEGAYAKTVHASLRASLAAAAW